MCEYQGYDKQSDIASRKLLIDWYRMPDVQISRRIPLMGIRTSGCL